MEEILNYISNNYKWIFGGIGVPAIGVFFWWRVKRPAKVSLSAGRDIYNAKRDINIDQK